MAGTLPDRNCSRVLLSSFIWLIQVHHMLQYRIISLSIHPPNIGDVPQPFIFVFHHLGLHHHFLAQGFLLDHQSWVIWLGSQLVALWHVPLSLWHFRYHVSRRYDLGHQLPCCHTLWGTRWTCMMQEWQPTKPWMHQGFRSSHMSGGLLSVFTWKGWYCRYSLNCSVPVHFSAKNLSFKEWYDFLLPFSPQLA